MRDAYVVGAAESDLGAFPDESYRSLFTTAFGAALGTVDGDSEGTEIDEAYIGTLGIGCRQLDLAGPTVTEYAGLDGVPRTRG